VGMLKEPVFTLKVNPEIVVVLRILKDVKKDFSVQVRPFSQTISSISLYLLALLLARLYASQTGCWLHFIWVSRTVSCYGLDSQSASDYVHHIIDGVRRCALSLGGCNGYIVAEQPFERKYKNLIKKYVDYIESKVPSSACCLRWYLFLWVHSCATLSNPQFCMCVETGSRRPNLIACFRTPFKLWNTASVKKSVVLFQKVQAP